MSAADWDRISLNYELTEEEFVEFQCPKGFSYPKFGVVTTGFCLLFFLLLYHFVGTEPLKEVVPLILGWTLGSGVLFTLEVWLLKSIILPALWARKYRKADGGGITRCYLFTEEKMTEIYAGRANSFAWESFEGWSERDNFLVVKVGKAKVPLPKRVMGPDELVRLRTLFAAKLHH